MAVMGAMDGQKIKPMRPLTPLYRPDESPLVHVV
jgi:hypothetical protein